MPRCQYGSREGEYLATNRVSLRVNAHDMTGMQALIKGRVSSTRSNYNGQWAARDQLLAETSAKWLLTHGARILSHFEKRLPGDLRKQIHELQGSAEAAQDLEQQAVPCGGDEPHGQAVASTAPAATAAQLGVLKHHSQRKTYSSCKPTVPCEATGAPGCDQAFLHRRMSAAPALRQYAAQRVFIVACTCQVNNCSFDVLCRLSYCELRKLVSFRADKHMGTATASEVKEVGLPGNMVQANTALRAKVNSTLPLTLLLDAPVVKLLTYIYC